MAVQVSQPLVALHRMEVFTGVWYGDVILSPSLMFPHGTTATATYTGQLDLAGCVVVGHDLHRQKEDLIYQALKVFGWDRDRQLYTLHLFEAGQSSPTAPAFGQWRDDTLALRGATERDQFSLVYTFKDKAHYIEQLSTSRNGEAWRLVVEGRYERLGQ